MSAVFLGKILQRIFDHCFVIFVQQFTIRLAPEEFPPFMIMRIGLDGPAILAAAPLRLPPAIFVLEESVANFVVCHDPSPARKYGCYTVTCA